MHAIFSMETVILPKIEFQKMKEELTTLRNSRLYKRLLDFEQRIMQGKKYSRKDLDSYIESYINV